VNAPEALRRRLALIGVVAPEDGPGLQADLLPGQRLVSTEGDLWRWDGFRAWAEDAPSASALRLQQINRLEELKQSLEHATARADGAARAHEVLKAQLEELTRADADARAARKAADQAMAAASRAASKAEADRNLAQGKLESLSLAVRRHEEEAQAARLRATEAASALKGLPALDGVRSEVEDLRLTVEAARITMMSRRSEQEELRRTKDARTKRAQEITKEISGWRHRLSTAETRSAELLARKESSETELETARALPSRIEEERAHLMEELARAESRKVKATDALAAGESALRAAQQAERDAERAASEARELRAAAEARLEAARETMHAAAERIAEEQQMTPNQLLNRLEVAADEMPRLEALEAEAGKLKRQRDALGAVNLRAEEDAKSVQDEHDTLAREKADLEEAIGALRSGISNLNREGRERLLTAFEQVNANFSMLFRHLFGGGEANLVMVESDDPLEAGLEIMCQPPGKKLSTLSLLSGGEQTLTALALIFGVFLANPAPICVLDEVDAPLDDANVTRFCDLLDEMCRRTETRFLIITHHAVTMSRMDRLFGVTMAEQGVSQLVSVDLKKAEKLVA
jgi:chromosome segregation protein